MVSNCLDSTMSTFYGNSLCGYNTIDNKINGAAAITYGL